MRDEIAKGVEMMLKGAGVAADTVRAVRIVLENDGMAPTPEACRALGVSRWTLLRACSKHGVRRVVRRGRGGSMVDLAHLERCLGV